MSKNCSLFLERVEQREKEGELFTHLISIRPDIDFNKFGIASLSEQSPIKPPPEPLPTSFIDFVNRKDEWQKVVLYHEAKGQYYVFDAPAGYGKTALLKKIADEFVQRNWKCLSLCISRTSQTWVSILNAIGKIVQSELFQYADTPYDAGQAVGKEIVRQHANVPFEGFAVLIDVDHEPLDQSVDTLAILVEQFIPGVYEGLHANSDYFSQTQWSFRVVITGRYLLSRIQQFKTSILFDATRLTTFSYEVVCDVCRLYGIRQEEEQREFAAHLLFYSGGHPRCMVRILERFKESGCSPAHFFAVHQQEIETIASEDTSWVRHSINKDWRLVFDTLCLYRLFDRHLLEHLIAISKQWTYLADDGYDLGLKLKQSYLVDWADEKRRHFRDDIVRRLLVIQRYHDVSDEVFEKECQDAEQLYLTRIETADYDRANWVIEALFAFLQSNVSKIHDKTARHHIRHTFLKKELIEALHILVQDRDPRSERDSLSGVLEHDWEFHFTLNYYLRDAVYNDSPYQQMLTRIDQFFSDLSRDSGGR